MSSNRYECVRVLNAYDESSKLTMGKVYTLTDVLMGGGFKFTGDDGRVCVWSHEHIDQFKLVERKLLGYIFCTKQHDYYLAVGLGTTAMKLRAYVFSREEATRLVDVHRSGHKREGNWRPVYE